MALNPTPGAVDADSYATLAEAEAYMATLIFKDAWTAVSDPLIKEAALKQAARLMNNLVWRGQRFGRYQSLAWPRCQGYSSRNTAEGFITDRDGYAVSWSEIPDCVKSAQIEFAFRLLSEDRSADAGALVSFGGSLASLKDPERIQHNPFPASVLAMVSQFLASRPGCIQAVRG